VRCGVALPSGFPEQKQGAITLLALGGRGGGDAATRAAAAGEVGVRWVRGVSSTARGAPWRGAAFRRIEYF